MVIQFKSVPNSRLSENLELDISHWSLDLELLKMALLTTIPHLLQPNTSLYISKMYLHINAREGTRRQEPRFFILMSGRDDSLQVADEDYRFFSGHIPYCHHLTATRDFDSVRSETKESKYRDLTLGIVESKER